MKNFPHLTGRVFERMIQVASTDFAACFVNDNHIMMAIRPINTSKPHLELLSWGRVPGRRVSLYSALEARSSNDQSGPGTRQGSVVSLSRSNRLERICFPRRIQHCLD